MRHDDIDRTAAEIAGHIHNNPPHWEGFTGYPAVSFDERGQLQIICEDGNSSAMLWHDRERTWDHSTLASLIRRDDAIEMRIGSRVLEIAHYGNEVIKLWLDGEQIGEIRNPRAHQGVHA